MNPTLSGCGQRKVSGDTLSGCPAWEELLVLDTPRGSCFALHFSPAAGAAGRGKASGSHRALGWGWRASAPGQVETSRLTNLLP